MNNDDLIDDWDEEDYEVFNQWDEEAKNKRLEELEEYFKSDNEIRAKLLTRIDRLNYSLEQANKNIKELQQENGTLEKGLEYAKRIEKDYKTKFDKAIEYIKDYLYIDNETGEYYLTHTFDASNLYELLKMLDKENK